MQDIFQALDFFVLRSPVLSANIYEKELTSFHEHYLDKMWELSKVPLIREAVLLSSISLFHSLSNLSPENSLQKREQTASSFLRYLIRMSTRPTPYGAFSGVSYGTYGN